MKSLLFITLLFLTPQISFANSCDTIENGKKTICNSYVKMKKSTPAKLKKLCSAGDMDMAYLKMKGVFNTTDCDPKGAIAKCRLGGHDTTFYYSGEMAVLKKGCKFFKKAEFIKL